MKVTTILFHFLGLFLWSICLVGSTYQQQQQQQHHHHHHFFEEDTIHIALTSCGLRSYWLIRGIIASLLENPASHRIHLHIFHDDVNRIKLSTQISILKDGMKNLTEYNVKEFEVDSIKIDPKYHSSRFPCAYFRLFLTELLPDYVERILYVDADTLVFEDLSNLWSNWKIMEEKNTTFAGVQEVEHPKDIIYFKKKEHFLHPSGINTGVLLMNLERMREQNLTGERLFAMNDEPVFLADQDVLNSYWYYNPDDYFELPCKWNRRIYSNCTQTSDQDYYNNQTGILHGNGGKFLHPSEDAWTYEIWCYYEDQYTQIEDGRLVVDKTSIPYKYHPRKEQQQRHHHRHRD
jgi:lipopolysaccharide biosynthesis glycosyltransferase